MFHVEANGDAVRCLVRRFAVDFERAVFGERSWVSYDVGKI